MTRWRPDLSAVLSFNAGYVDTVGFLALQGLFTAHVTGNFVTLGAALVLGTSGVVAKLLALPVFGVTVALVRRTSQRTMLMTQCGLLTLFAILAWSLGPFPDGDRATAVLTGMVGVAAMAVQNALQRIHLGTAPPTTLMTGNTTQAMIDFVDLARNRPERPALLARLRRNATGVACFAGGCALGAVLFVWGGMAAFAPPVLICVCALMMTLPTFEARGK